MTRARRIGCGSDRVADGGTPEVSESRGRGVANGEKPSGGARETRLKSRIDRSAGGRRGDDAAIGRQPERDIVDTADGVARDRPGDRESVAPRGQGGASGRHFFLCDSATEESGRTNPTPRLRVGLQSTLGLSPDSSVAIDCQNVSPEPGAFDDTTGPARPSARVLSAKDVLRPTVFGRKFGKRLPNQVFVRSRLVYFLFGEIEGLMIRPLLPCRRERKGLR